MFGALGKALKAPLKPINKAVGKVPGMNKIAQAAPGLRAGGIGPSPAASGIGGMMQKMKPPQPMQPQQGMQNMAQNAAGAVGAAFGRPPQNQLGNFGGMAGGTPQALSPMMAKMQMMQPKQPMPEMTPEPTAPASPVYNDQNTPELQDMKQQQLAGMQQLYGGNSGIARPMGPSFGGMSGMMQRFGGMNRPMPMQSPQEDQVSMPDESVDAMRRNKFSQMRGIGPRMGGGGPMQY